MATKRSVTKGADGLWRVSGQGPECTYLDEATAQRSAAKLSHGDAVEEAIAAGQPPPEWTPTEPA